LGGRFFPCFGAEEKAHYEEKIEFEEEEEKQKRWQGRVTVLRHFAECACARRFGC